MFPLLLWKSSMYYLFWVCVCSLSYPACNAHAPYYIVICGVSGCTIFFPNYVINCTIFGGGRVIVLKCVFWFSLQLLCITYLILKIIQRCIIVSVSRSSCKVPVIPVRFWWKSNSNATGFRQIFNIKFHKNASIGSQIVQCGRTDRHDETNSRFSKFRRKRLKISLGVTLL